MVEYPSEQIMVTHPDPNSLQPAIPDASDPAFVEDCRRQSEKIRDNAAAEAADLDFIEQISADLRD